MAESEYARKMRREAELQTEYAFQALQETEEQTRLAAEQAEQSRLLLHQQAARAAELLDSQMELARSVQSHNFAMWRETTESGEIYTSWARKASGLVRKFDERWELWQAAIASDKEKVHTKRRSQAVMLFDLHSPQFRFVSGRSTSSLTDALKRIGIGFLSAAILSPLLAVAGSIINSIWDIHFLSQDYSVALVMLYVPAALFAVYSLLEILVLHPRTKLMLTKEKEAKAWVENEVQKFSEAIPDHWNDDQDDDIWDTLVEAERLINSMQDSYADFDPSMLLPLPAALPRPLKSDSLPEEAVKARSLLASWRHHV